MTPRRESAEFGFGYAIPGQRRRLQWKRLSWPALFPWNVAGRYGTFFRSKHRLTRSAIENEEQPHLGGFCNSRDVRTPARNSHQRGRRCHVVIEQIVVNDLVEPAHFSGRCVERDHGV